MKKKNHLIFLPHIYLTILTLVVIAIISVVMQYHSSTAQFHDFIDIITFVLVWVLIFGLVSIPMFIGIYITYSNLSKKKFKRILQLIVYPLMGAAVVPGYFLFNSIKDNDNWVDFGFVLFGISNLILYIVNEVFMFIKVKNLK